MALDGQEINVLYQSIAIGAGIRIGDVGQPYILVPFGLGMYTRRYRIF